MDSYIVIIYCIQDFFKTPTLNFQLQNWLKNSNVHAKLIYVLCIQNNPLQI